MRHLLAGHNSGDRNDSCALFMAFVAKAAMPVTTAHVTP
jgi:hypothetical protein